MFKEIELSHTQWRRLAAALSNISQAVIIFALAAIFVPQAVGLDKDFSHLTGFIYLFWGLFILIAAIIISKREDEL